MKKLLGAYLISTVCSWTVAFLIPLYVLELTKSASWTALTYFAAMAPYILVTPFAGVWSDRYGKKTFLILGDLGSAAVAAMIYFAIVMLADIVSVNMLVVALLLFNFLLACIAATNHPMLQSLAPEILLPESLKQFNAIINAIDNIVRIIAPLLLASLLMFTTKQAVLIACGAGFSFSLLLLVFLPRPVANKQIHAGVLAELIEGLKYVYNDANLVSFSLLFFCVNFGLAIIGSNLIYIFSSILGVAQQNIGYYYGIIGIGAVAGSFIAPILIGKFEDAHIIILSCLMAGILAILECFATTPLLLALIWAVATACLSIVVVTFFTFRQKMVPQALLGRTVGITRLISYLAIPPASIIGGVLMDATHSAIAIMAIGGGSIIAGALIALRSQAFHLPQRKEIKNQ